MPVPIGESEMVFDNDYTSSSFTQANRPRSNTFTTREAGGGFNHDDGEEDSDTDTVAPHPSQQDRTRQKKFIKYFKDLSDEIVYESNSTNVK